MGWFCETNRPCRLLAIVWRHRLKGKFRASPLFADGRIDNWSVDGETVVIEPGDTYRELARNRLDGAIRATPTISDASILVRTETHLYRLVSKAKL